MNYVDPLKMKINPVTGKELSDQYYKRNKQFITEYKLPVLTKEIYNEFKEKILNNDVLIIESTTGSGKSIGSAPILQRIFDYKVKILLSQPRTVTIEPTAQIIAEQLDLTVGQEIGYQYSGGHKENPKKTLIYIVTDFFLIKLLNSSDTSDKQRKLEGIRKSGVDYDIYIVDEVHERGVNMDIFMTAMKMYYRDFKPEQGKNKKKLILLSATLDVDKFKRYYEKYANVGHIKITKKPNPIYNMYLDEDIPDKDLNKYDAAIVETVTGLLENTYMANYERWKKKTCIKCSTTSCFDENGRYIPCEINTTNISNSSTGDILVFMPTTSRAKRMVKTFKLWAKGEKVIQWKRNPKTGRETATTKKDPKGKKYASKVFFASLARTTNSKDRLYVTDLPEKTYIKDGYKRRVIFSTPIAETGITITGIKFVIESGVENKISFDPLKRRQMQYISYIRKPSVIQRCGRAGRREPGVCIHIYSLETYHNRFKTRIIPKIYTDDIHSVFLTLLYHTLDVRLTVDYMENLPDPIDTSLMGKTLQDLYSMKIIDSNSLSRKGIALVNLGLDFYLALLIVETYKLEIKNISDEKLNEIRTTIAKHMIPIVAILSIEPNLDNWLEKKHHLFRNKYGDIIAMLMMYTHYYNSFIKRNYKLIRRSLKSPEKGKIFRDNLRRWCYKEGFNYFNIKDLLPKIFNIFKKIKRGKEYFYEYKLLKKEEEKAKKLIEREKLHELRESPEVKLERQFHQTPKLKLKEVPKTISRDDIHTMIIKIFSKVYDHNKAIYSPKVNSYILESGEPIGKPRSDFIDFRDKPSLIGFTDMIYLEKVFPQKGMQPILTAPFVILRKDQST